MARPGLRAEVSYAELVAGRLPSGVVAGACAALTAIGVPLTGPSYSPFYGRRPPQGFPAYDPPAPTL